MICGSCFWSVIQMRYELFFLDDECGTVTEFIGVLNDEILIQVTRERYASEERNRKLKYILNDYTQCTEINISSEIIRTVAQMAINVAAYNQQVVIAGVMPTDLEFGLGRMWQVYAEKTGWESRAFRSRSDAEEWIQNTMGVPLHFNTK